MIFFLQIWLSWELDLDPDPHSEKLLNSDPHKMNADPQPWPPGTDLSMLELRSVLLVLLLIALLEILC